MHTLKNTIARLADHGIRLTVAFDMDDVLTQWASGFYEVFYARFPGVHITPEHERDTFQMFLPEDKHAHPQIMEVMNLPGFYRGLKPVPGARETLLTLKELGIDTPVATSPWRDNPTCADDKYWWLDNVIGEGFSAEANLTWDKTRIRGHLLFDDKDQVRGKMVPEWEHIIVDAPHNRWVTGQPRVQSIRDWRPVVEERAERLLAETLGLRPAA